MGHLAVAGGEGAEGERLARLHAHRPEVDIALLRQHLLDDVVVAARDAGGGDEHVGVQPLADLRRERIDGVRGDPQRPRDAAALSHHRRDAVGVAVVDLAGLDRLAWLQQLVAGREDGDDWPADHPHRRLA